MRRYLINLLTALRGHNPFEEELGRVKEDYKRVAAQVAQLQSEYDAVKEKTASTVNQTRRLQNLVENLRKHLKEKDTLVKRMKADYQKCINDYNKKLDKLQRAAN